MPTNDFVVIPKIMYWLLDVKPKSVLDVGSGFGKWGVLVKEYIGLDWDVNMSAWVKTGKVPVKVDGVEICRGFIKDLQKEIYDNIYVENALDYLARTKEKYDCIMLMDVLEHLTKPDGYHLLDLCLSHSDNVLISTPFNAMVWMNWNQEFPREEHLSGWNIDDFKDYNVIDFAYVDQWKQQRKQLLVRIEYGKKRLQEILDKSREFVEGVQ